MSSIFEASERDLPCAKHKREVHVRLAGTSDPFICAACLHEHLQQRIQLDTATQKEQTK